MCLSRSCLTQTAGLASLASYAQSESRRHPPVVLSTIRMSHRESKRNLPSALSLHNSRKIEASATQRSRRPTIVLNSLGRCGPTVVFSVYKHDSSKQVRPVVRSFLCHNTSRLEASITRGSCFPCTLRSTEVGINPSFWFSCATSTVKTSPLPAVPSFL